MAWVMSTIVSFAAFASIPALAQTLDTREGEDLYRAACATCHGGDGRGVDRSLVMFEEALPDFTDCSFSSREPAADWVIVAHQGGPVRGFSRMMPAFGRALTDQQLERTIRYVKSLCKESAWPGGELNLPRSLFTEKAYPEDEWVLETTTALKGPTSVIHNLIYEKRIGPRSQFEIALPFGYRREVNGGDSRWLTGVGDVALGFKHALSHSVASGHILSAVAELKLPTGSEAKGFGSGHKVAEGFLAFAKLLPADAFVQLQAGGERALVRGAESELFWNAAVGKTFSQGRWGRAWSPMLEFLGTYEDEDGLLWDIAPQLHVSLNTRQHVMLTLGPRIPLNGTRRRSSFAINLLWDWFDGGLFDGW